MARPSDRWRCSAHHQGLLSLVYLCTSDIFALINYASFIESSFILCSICGLLYLRWKDPQRERPIRVGGATAALRAPGEAPRSDLRPAPAGRSSACLGFGDWVKRF